MGTIIGRIFGAVLIISTVVILAVLGTYGLVAGWNALPPLTVARPIVSTASAAAAQAPAAAVPAQAQPPAQVANAPTPNYHNGSWNRGPSEPITQTSVQPVATGKISFGEIPIKIAAGKAVVIECYEYRLPGKEKKTGPGFVVINGPYEGNVWVHDGQAWPVDPSQVAGLIQSIKANWATGPMPLVAAFCDNCP